MMINIVDQIRNIDPSAKDALFRRLLYEKDLAYLRPDEKHIIGFDVDLNNKPLSGYALIAIQKHTILAFKSDADEELKLILFPDMEKLRDRDFALDDINVTRNIYGDDTFNGEVVKTGTLYDVTQDLTPPFKHIDLDSDVSAKFATMFTDNKNKENAFSEVNDPQIDDPNTPQDDLTSDVNDVPDDDVDDDIPMDDFNDPTSFDDTYDDYDDSILDDDTTLDDNTTESDTHIYHQVSNNESTTDENKLMITDSRGADLNNKNQTFKSIQDLTHYVVVTYHVNGDIANNVANAAIQGSDNVRNQIDTAILLYIKLFNMHKIGDDPDEGAF